MLHLCKRSLFMEDFSISAISPLTTLKLQKILTSNKLTNQQKAQFMRKHSVEIKNIMNSEISKGEFAQMMKNRPLIRFRPFKNSFTKRGDRKLLAQALGIKENEINKYITNIIDNNFDIKHDVTASNIDKVKTYVYRHGTKDEVVEFLRYELSDVQNALTKLYKILDDNSGGLCEYFSRPIHRMDNITLGKLYNTIDKSLHASYEAGYLPKEKLNSTSQWALVRIYQIQNNSKLIRAYKAL